MYACGVMASVLKPVDRVIVKVKHCGNEGDLWVFETTVANPFQVSSCDKGLLVPGALSESGHVVLPVGSYVAAVLDPAGSKALYKSLDPKKTSKVSKSGMLGVSTQSVSLPESYFMVSFLNPDGIGPELGMCITVEKVTKELIDRVPSLMHNSTGYGHRRDNLRRTYKMYKLSEPTEDEPCMCSECCKTRIGHTAIRKVIAMRAAGKKRSKARRAKL